MPGRSLPNRADPQREHRMSAVGRGWSPRWPRRWGTRRTPAFQGGRGRRARYRPHPGGGLAARAIRHPTYDHAMAAHPLTAEDGHAALVMFARGDRVFPFDDLGGGIWSRRGTVLAVHPAGRREPTGQTGPVRVDSTRVPLPVTARATVLWDDGSAEVLAEDQLCLVYDQEAPVGMRVVT